jgi:hypothetical protein
MIHIGVRTVTAILRGLMDHLDVSNRFQLGFALGAMRVVRRPTDSTTRGDE